MLLVLVSLWHLGICGLIDLQLLRAFCQVETWITLGAALHHTGAWTRQKVLASRDPSMLWGVQSYHLWLCTAAPPSPAPPHWPFVQAPLWALERRWLPSQTQKYYFFVLVLIQSHLPPSSILDPHPQDQENPFLEEFHTRRDSWWYPIPLGLYKHFLGVHNTGRRYWVCVHFTLKYVVPQIIVWFSLGHSSGQCVSLDFNPDLMSWSPWLYRCLCSSVKFTSGIFLNAFIYGTLLSLMGHILLSCWIY